MANWFVQRHRTATPVFGMLWTNMPHYPYFTDSILLRFGTDENLLNRYLNALHAGDAAFSTLMKSLEQAAMPTETYRAGAPHHAEPLSPHNQLTPHNCLPNHTCHVPLT